MTPEQQNQPNMQAQSHFSFDSLYFQGEVRAKLISTFLKFATIVFFGREQKFLWLGSIYSITNS